LLLLEWSAAPDRHAQARLKIGKSFVSNWLRQRNASDPLVESDARALIERFGEDAYLEARLRQHNDEQVIDGNRPPGHWGEGQGSDPQVAEAALNDADAA
jgi:hypothetical protein